MAGTIKTSDITALYKEIARVRKARGDVAGAASAVQSAYGLRVAHAARELATGDTLAKRVERISKVTRPASLPPVPASRLTVEGNMSGLIPAALLGEAPQAPEAPAGFTALGPWRGRGSKGAAA